MIVFLALCILFLAGAAQVGWVEIDYKDEDGTSYVNTSNLRAAGDKVYYWEMMTYAKPRLINEKSSLSQLNQAVINCKTLTQAFLYLSWYDRPNATGQITKFLFIPQNAIDFRPIAPESLADIERKVVCSTQFKPT